MAQPNETYHEVPIPGNPQWRYYPHAARTPSPRSMPEGVEWPPSPLTFGLPLTPAQRRAAAAAGHPKSSSRAFGEALFFSPAPMLQAPVPVAREEEHGGMQRDGTSTVPTVVPTTGTTGGDGAPPTTPVHPTRPFRSTIWDMIDMDPTSTYVNEDDDKFKTPERKTTNNVQLSPALKTPDVTVYPKRSPSSGVSRHMILIVLKLDQD